jgi:hypothetical protein
VGDRDEGIMVEIVGGPKDGTQGLGIPGVTESIMWRDPSGRVLVHRFRCVNEAGNAVYDFIGYEVDKPPLPGSQN